LRGALGLASGQDKCVWRAGRSRHPKKRNARRRVEYLACTSKPDSAWMLQQARNLLMELDERGRQGGS
jgi:hypothetical protein